MGGLFVFMRERCSEGKRQRIVSNIENITKIVRYRENAKMVNTKIEAEKV